MIYKWTVYGSTCVYLVRRNDAVNREWPCVIVAEFECAATYAIVVACASMCARIWVVNTDSPVLGLVFLSHKSGVNAYDAQVLEATCVKARKTVSCIYNEPLLRTCTSTDNPGLGLVLTRFVIYYHRMCVAQSQVLRTASVWSEKRRFTEPLSRLWR